jgi:hypothetical protein
MPAPHVEHPFMNGSVGSIRATWAAMLAAVVVTTSGCTSAISTAYLRDTFWDLPDHAAAEEPQADATADAEGQPAVEISDTGVADEERREAAIDEAVVRLAKIGALDPAARATLVETLQRTQQEDWPVVVEAFASSLAAASPPPRLTEHHEADEPADAPAPVVTASHTVAKADLDEASTAPAAAPEPVTPLAEPAVPPSAPQAIAPAPTPSAPEPDDQAQRIVAAPAPSLAVRNACFATRVQAWGMVDRFQTARFRPGQEVIVYFELGGSVCRRPYHVHRCVARARRGRRHDGSRLEFRADRGDMSVAASRLFRALCDSGSGIGSDRGLPDRHRRGRHARRHDGQGQPTARDRSRFPLSLAWGVTIA